MVKVGGGANQPLPHKHLDSKGIAMTALETALEQKVHKWSGWPGAHCTVCGAKDKVEDCSVNHPEDCHCTNGPCPGTYEFRQEVSSAHSYTGMTTYEVTHAPDHHFIHKHIINPANHKSHWMYKNTDLTFNFDHTTKKLKLTLANGTQTVYTYYGVDAHTCGVATRNKLDGKWTCFDYCDKCRTPFVVVGTTSDDFPPHVDDCPNQCRSGWRP